jgi:hypothetical protein
LAGWPMRVAALVLMTTLASYGVYREMSQPPANAGAHTNPQSPAPGDRATPSLVQPKPKDLRSDLAHLADLARALRLKELRGGAQGESVPSTFIVTGATECEVRLRDDGVTSAHCTFSASRVSAKDLLSAAKLAWPELSWRDEKDENWVEMFWGSSPAHALVMVAQGNKNTPTEADIYVYEYEK